MSTPGLKIEDVFKRVRRSVLAETNEAQTPWESSSLLGDFYFSGKGGQGAQPAAYAPPATPPPAATPAPPQQAGTPAGRRFRDCPDCPEMVEIPAGRFLFGSDRAAPGRATNEGPETVVTTRAFALGRTEVTRDEFARFVAETGHRASEGCWLIVLVWIHDGGLNWQDPGYPQRGDHPAVCISRADAEAYAAWMSRRTGASYRLPSEAELEWAMGGDRTGPWGKVGGDDPGFCRLANGHDESAFAAFGNVLWARVPCDDGYAYTAPVGSYPDGPFGLKDIHGNVGEWAADCWNDGHATAPADGSAARSGDCGKGVLKGASWIAAPADHRPAWRHPAIADDGSVYSGMRLARDL